MCLSVLLPRGDINLPICLSVYLSVHPAGTTDFINGLPPPPSWQARVVVLMVVKWFGLSYKRKDHLWSKAWSAKCVQNWQIYPFPVDLPVDLNSNFGFLLLELIWADQLADLPPKDLPVNLNGNFSFLLLELIWTDQLADLPPSRSASGSG